MNIDLNDINGYKRYLVSQEKAEATICRYIACIMKFYEFMVENHNVTVTREQLLAFKKKYARSYSISSTNTEIIALNGFFEFLGVEGYSLSTVRCQRTTFRRVEVELSQEEMEQLYQASKDDNCYPLTYVILSTLSGTGIRVSELRFVTVEAMNCGYITIYLKGKERVVPLSEELLKVLREYCRQERIEKGTIFLNQKGDVLHRSQVWRILKKLAVRAGVDTEKVFPHNFRHMFAIAYYEINKDICELANLLGHSSIETTRIYLQKSMRDCMQTLGMVFSRWDAQIVGQKATKT